ncbi:FecR family protein [Leptospira interrogans]|uniref:FecR family protein n=1 Tax=Leptospira interrogans TaxID=173 RepID=UPI001781B27D|nr:FecR family protein [Leptospira interrogans]MBE0304571.1 FecR domain-containing protein [Leptospira interrogans serovar Yeoncheon]
MNYKIRILFLIILLSAIASSITLLSQETENAKVSFLLGKSYVQKSGKSSWEPLKPNDFLEEGDLISTGNGSRITVHYKGSEFKIQQNSKVKLSNLPEKSKRGVLEVNQGFAWFKIVNLKGKKFEVTTPNSTAGVRGTSFSAFYDPKTRESSFCTCKGKVSISDPTGKEILFQEKGEGTIVSSKDIEIKKLEYKGIIKKLNTLSGFEERLKKNPFLKNCLSCHTPEGWIPQEEILKDETYGKQ